MDTLVEELALLRDFVRDKTYADWTGAMSCVDCAYVYRRIAAITERAAKEEKERANEAACKIVVGM